MADVKTKAEEEESFSESEDFKGITRSNSQTDLQEFPKPQEETISKNESKQITRNKSSPMLSKNIIIEREEEIKSKPKQEEKDSKNTKLELTPKVKPAKKRSIISSKLSMSGPIQNPTNLNINKKKRKRKLTLSSESKKENNKQRIRAITLSSEPIDMKKLQNDSEHTNNEIDPLSPKMSPRCKQISPKGRPRKESPRTNVEIYARHSGLNSNTLIQQKHEISEEQTKRFRIIQELRDTERTYVTSLHMVSVIFISPLRSKMNTPKQILSSKELDSIFGNIEDVCKFSQKFLEAIEVKIHPSVWNNETPIGDLFNQLMDESEMSDIYREYVNTYESALRIIRNSFNSENSLFGDFARERQVLCDNHSLSSLLVLPIQRIPRYQLLLQDLIKATPENHKDKSSLTMAHKKMVTLANYLNESKWREESQQKMREISLKFQKCFHSDLNAKGRELLTQVSRNIITITKINF